MTTIERIDTRKLSVLGLADNYGFDEWDIVETTDCVEDEENDFAEMPNPILNVDLSTDEITEALIIIADVEMCGYELSMFQDFDTTVSAVYQDTNSGIIYERVYTKEFLYTMLP